MAFSIVSLLNLRLLLAGRTTGNCSWSAKTAGASATVDAATAALRMNSRRFISRRHAFSPNTMAFRSVKCDVGVGEERHDERDLEIVRHVSDFAHQRRQHRATQNRHHQQR